MLERLKALLTNKQFLLAVVAVVVIFIKSIFPALPVSEDDISRTFWVLVALIVGVPISDLTTTLKAQMRMQLKQ